MVRVGVLVMVRVMIGVMVRVRLKRLIVSFCLVLSCLNLRNLA